MRRAMTTAVIEMTINSLALVKAGIMI